ncbi:MAG: hypothetical protein HYZ13_14845 [Acidobacteria bacterium]|nr:hypothetical protein [Acidobacteriota bacterium]
MTRIHSLALEQGNSKEGRFLLVQVAHANMRGALRVALAEAAKQGGRWRLVHKSVRRTGLAIPTGEVMGVTGPFDYAVED